MKYIAQNIQAVVKDIFGVDQQVILSRPDAQFGDY